MKMSLQISELEPDIVSVGIGCITLGAILRILCTAGIAFGDHLNMKEKFFVSLSWMSKATVQAALGPVALKHLASDSSDDLKKYAYIVQTVSVLSILLTAPLGAILISVTGTKLLTKTKQPQVTDGMFYFSPQLLQFSILILFSYMIKFMLEYYLFFYLFTLNNISKVRIIIYFFINR